MLKALGHCWHTPGHLPGAWSLGATQAGLLHASSRHLSVLSFNLPIFRRGCRTAAMGGAASRSTLHQAQPPFPSCALWPSGKQALAVLQAVPQGAAPLPLTVCHPAPACSTAGLNFEGESTFIKRTPGLPELRANVLRAAAQQGLHDVDVERTVLEAAKGYRIVLVSVHAIRRLNQQGIRFHML